MQRFSVYMHRRTSLGSSNNTRIRPNMSTTFKQFNNKAVILFTSAVFAAILL